MKISDVKFWLREANIEFPDLESRILLEDLAGLSFVHIISNPDAEIELDASLKIQDALARRVNGEPISRILGYREFYGRRFYLSKETLDPRPDTETLIEAVLSHKWESPRILDLGTGTGCILLTLIHELPGSTGIGIDLSPDACATASRNALEQGIDSRVEIRQGDWTENLSGQFDIIVSNPPYIPSRVIPTLSREVQNHDPILALDGGEDGLAPYKKLLSTLKKFLVPHGVVFFEVGHGQADDIGRLAAAHEATLSRVWDDLGGVGRVCEVRYGDK